MPSSGCFSNTLAARRLLERDPQCFALMLTMLWATGTVSLVLVAARPARFDLSAASASTGPDASKDLRWSETQRRSDVRETL